MARSAISPPPSQQPRRVPGMLAGAGVVARLKRAPSARRTPPSSEGWRCRIRARSPVHDLIRRRSSPAMGQRHLQASVLELILRIRRPLTKAIRSGPDVVAQQAGSSCSRLASLYRSDATRHVVGAVAVADAEARAGHRIGDAERACRAAPNVVCPSPSSPRTSTTSPPVRTAASSRPAIPSPRGSEVSDDAHGHDETLEPSASMSLKHDRPAGERDRAGRYSWRDGDKACIGSGCS